MQNTEFQDLVDGLQENPDIVDDMRKVFMHWLDETIDHLKSDNKTWEALVNLGFYPALTQAQKNG